MGRPRRGERRIDAAIDRLSHYGFPRPDIRRVINELLQLYGRDGWVFLEEGSYRIVLDRLLEEQAQQQQQQQQEAAADEAPPENDAQISEVHAPAESESAVEQAKPRARPIEYPPLEPIVLLPGPAATGTVRPRPPCFGWISDSESESDNGESAVEQLEPPASPRHEVIAPPVNVPIEKWPPAGPRHEVTAPPVNVPTPGGGLLPRRKRPS